ncbi:MAG TPA: SAM-dependent methyltransferase, partial [Polyangiales bacterium]|nr:SAM-dependent methyltransferase [Polyangiales bacterium]
MQAEKPSQTASMVAALRGLAAYLPAEARLVEDPYGLAFGGKLARGAARMLELAPELSRKLTSTWQSKNVLWLQLRTRAIDDALRAFAADGGKQVVLLGAGFDCRALRMREQLPGVQFFEVDHPATQAEKKRVLSELRAESPARYLAWNFEQDPMPELPARLSALGLDRTQRVFTVWEGVSMYLTEPAIVATLATVRAYAPPSSQLVFTYIERAGLARPSFVSRLVA